jgi:hypothetical protein
MNVRALLCCVLAAAPASARSWHVTPTGSGDAPGTLEKPLRSLERALALAAEGDTVLVAAGTYAVQPSSLPITVARARVTLQGGWDTTFAKRDPFGTPSVFTAPADFDRPLLFITPEARATVVDGLWLEGGTGARYNDRKSLSETAHARIFPLIRVERARDVVIRLCTLLNSPGHGVAGSITTSLAVEDSVVVNTRVSALTGWGVQQGAVFTVRRNTVLGVWAEKPGGERGDAVDIQRSVKAVVDGNVVDDVQGACVRVGRGNETPSILGNALGRCAGGSVKGWPLVGPAVEVPLADLERMAWLDARLNVPLGVTLPGGDVGAFAAEKAMLSVPDAGKPPAPPYAPRWTQSVVALLGMEPRAGARLAAP